MNLLFPSLIAVSAYLAATTRVSLVQGAPVQGRSGWPFLSLAMLAVTVHAGLLYQGILTPAGISLGFFNAASLVTWMIALLVLLTALLRPVENLAVVLFPLAALAALLAEYFPHTRILLSNDLAPGVAAHIVASILAYSLLSLSALQALFLAVQDSYLHHKKPAKIMRRLPPLQVMESLLFQLMTAGFVLLTLSLLTGALFLENIFAQHLVHKTVLSLCAWLIFGLLLGGRWRYGWRGRSVIRWILTGFVVLMLSYFGSKLVLELILKR